MHWTPRRACRPIRLFCEVTARGGTWLIGRCVDFPENTLNIPLGSESSRSTMPPPTSDWLVRQSEDVTRVLVGRREYSPSRIRWKPTEWSRHFFPIKSRQVAGPASVHHEVLPMDELMSSESSRDSLGIGKCLSVFLCRKKSS